jgi:hypothetical protein
VEQRNAAAKENGDLGQDQVIDQCVGEELADEGAPVEVDPVKAQRSSAPARLEVTAARR